jgi:EF-P beta-lysylation protein EpmB
MLWRSIQKNNFKHLSTLLDYLEMSLENRHVFLEKHPFVLNLPIRLAQKIEKNNPSDPILKQFVPSKLELSNDGLDDPVEDHTFQKTPSLLQKYKARALIITTSACAMHCRYCFRKNYDYQKPQFSEEIDFIKNDTSIEEILLSGGDPLSLSDEPLFQLLDQLDTIDHLKRIRFHTRFLIGIPERIHEGFLKKLKSLSKQIIFVIHVNHKNELDDDIMAACKSILSLGIPVLSQTVLLKGVNNSTNTLVELFKSLINFGVIPYYLHQFDPVRGSMHFEVDIESGLKIVEELRNYLPGYAVPTYVQEIPQKDSKTPLVKPPACC